jgi:chromosome segregation ATPase
VVRVKNDLKVQMERLRTNMGNMLKEGGEESKYLEKHNMQLQMDLDARNDEIALLKEQLSNKEGEMIAVRAELHIYLDDMKMHTQENYLLKEQLSRMEDKARELEDEVVRMNTQKGLAEQRVHDAAGEARDSLMEKDGEIDGLRAEFKIARDGAEAEAAELRAALAAQSSRNDDLKMQLGNKNLECARLEKDQKLVVTRFEKKLATIKGHLENQRKGSQELVLALEERNGELESQSDNWKHKFEEAQQWVDQMNGFLEGRTELDGGDEGRAYDSEEDEERSMDSTSRYEETDASFASVSRRDTASSETMESARSSLVVSTASAAATPDARLSTLSAVSVSALTSPIRMTSPSKSKESLLHVDTFETAVRFAALRHALGVATKAFRHCVDDEAVVRRFLIAEHQREYDTADKFGAELHRFNTQSTSVVKYRKHLEKTVKALEERGEKSTARSEALAKEIEGYREQNKGLLVHTAYMAKRSDMQMNEAKALKIQNDKLRFDLRDLHAAMAALASERDDATAALERTTDDSIDLSSRLGTLNQKYFVMETERDELMKIFQSKHKHSG